MGQKMHDEDLYSLLLQDYDEATVAFHVTLTSVGAPCSICAVDKNGDVLFNLVVAECLPEADALGVKGYITSFETVCSKATSVGGPRAIVVTHHESTSGGDRCA